LRFKDSQNRNLITSCQAGILKVTHYHYGNPVPKVTNNTAWINQGNFTVRDYCDYLNATGLSCLSCWILGHPGGVPPRLWKRRI